MANRTEEVVTIEAKRDTRQKIKVLAVLEKQSMIEWLEWIVDRAYKVQLSANKKK